MNIKEAVFYSLASIVGAGVGAGVTLEATGHKLELDPAGVTLSYESPCIAGTIHKNSIVIFSLDKPNLVGMGSYTTSYDACEIFPGYSPTKSKECLTGDKDPGCIEPGEPLPLKG